MIALEAPLTDDAEGLVENKADPLFREGASSRVGQI
jgi:hypothetical protein